MKTKLIKIFFGLILLLFTVNSAFADQGGDDGFGHMWTDENGATSINYSWIDVNSSAARLLGPNFDNDAPVSYTLPFDFSFYGTAYNQIYVSPNGWLSFDDPGVNSYPDNDSLPVLSPNISLITPFWSDLISSVGNSGGIYVDSVGSYPNRKIVIQWDIYYRQGAPTYHLEFEAILFEGSNLIKFQYKTIDSWYNNLTNTNYTVGIQQDSLDGITYADSVANAVSGGSAIFFHNKTLTSGAQAQISPNTATTGELVQFTYIIDAFDATGPDSLGKADRFTISSPFTDVDNEPVVTSVTVNGTDVFLQNSSTKPDEPGYATWTYDAVNDSIIIQTSLFNVVNSLSAVFAQYVPENPTGVENYLSRYSAELDSSPAFPASDVGYDFEVTVGDTHHVILQSVAGDTAVGGVVFTSYNMTVDEFVTLYAEGYDQYNNYIGAATVDWSSTGSLDDLSTLGIPTTGVSYDFYPINAPTSGTIVADAGSEVTGDATGTITVGVGDTSYIVIRTAPGNQGISIIDTSITTDESLTLYAAGYDAANNYIGDVVATWGNGATIPGLDDVSGTGTSYIFRPITSNTFGEIAANRSGLMGDVTGTISVTGGVLTTIRIRTDANNSGVVYADTSLTTDESLTLYAAGYDGADNYLHDLNVTWSSTGNLTPAVSGGGASYVFNPTTANTSGRIEADTSTVTGTTGTISVSAGAVSYVLIRDASNGGGGEVGAFSMTTDENRTFYAAGYDSEDNYVSDVSVVWGVTGTLDNALSPGSGTSTVFSPSTSGTNGTVTATPGGLVTNDATGAISVTGGVLTTIRIRTDANNSGVVYADTSLTTDESLTLYAAGYDGADNYLHDLNVTWSSTGNLTPAVSGGGASYVFNPTTANTSGRIEADTSTVTGTTGTISVGAGAVSYVLIRDASNGGGGEVGAFSMTTDENRTFYAAGYDSEDNYVSDVSVVWGVTGTLDNALSPGSGTSTVFSPSTSGTNGTVTATPGGLVTNDATGAISVTGGALTTIRIRTDANNSGVVYADTSLTTDESLTLYAAGYDGADNYLHDLNVTWSSTGNLTPAVSGGGASYVFNPTTANTSGRIEADTSTVTGTTGTISVGAGAVSYVLIRDASNGGGGEVGAFSMTTDENRTFYAAGYDSEDNYVSDVSVVWGVTGTLDNALSPGSGTSTVFSPSTSGTNGTVTATPGGLVTDDATGAISVTGGVLTTIRIRTDANNSGVVYADTSLTTDESLTLYAAGYDGADNYLHDLNVTWSSTGNLTPAVSGGGASYVFNPTTANTSGRIEADTSTVTGTTGTISVGAGATQYLVIRSEPNGNGSEIDVVNLNVGQSLNLYANGYDSDDNFTENTAVDWHTTGTLSGLINTSNTYSTILQPTTPGTGTVRTSNINGWTNDTTGTITVTTSGPASLTRIEIRTAAGENGGVVLNDSTAAAGDTWTLWATGYDNYDNYLGNIDVDWTVGVPSDSIGYFSIADSASSNTFNFTTVNSNNMRISKWNGVQPVTYRSGVINVSAGEAASIVSVSADTVSGRAAEEVADPIVVRVFDAFNNPVGYVSVDWETNTGGSFEDPQTSTDILGFTNNTWILKSSTGLDSAYAIVSTIPDTVKFIANVLESSANSIFRYATSDSARTDTVGQDVQSLVIQVLDSLGNPVPDVSITFGVGSVPAGANNYEFSPASGLTESDGTISTDFTIGDKVGVYNIIAYNHELANSGYIFFSITALPDDPALLQIIAGNQQSGTVAQSLADSVKVRVVDQYENIVSGVTVDWSATASGSVNPPSSISDISGITAALWTLRQLAGADTLITSSSGVSDIIFTAQALAGTPFTVYADSGQNKTSVAGGNMILRSRVEDQLGNVVRNANVRFQPLAPDGYVSQSIVQTDASGLASTIYTNPADLDSTNVNAFVAGVDTIRFKAYHLRYVDDSLDPKPVPSDTVIAFYVDVSNPGPDTVPLDAANTIFSFANNQFTTDLDSPLTVVAGGMTSLKFNQDSITSDFSGGSYTPSIRFAGTGIYQDLNGKIQTNQGELVIEPVYIKSIQTAYPRLVKVGDSVYVDMTVVNRGNYPVNIQDIYLTFDPNYSELVQTREDTFTVITNGEEKQFRFKIKIQPGTYNLPDTIDVDGYFRCKCTGTHAILTDNSSDVTDYLVITEAVDLTLLSFAPTRVSENQTVTFTANIQNIGQYDLILDGTNTRFVFGAQSFTLGSNQAIAGSTDSDIMFSTAALSLSNGTYPGTLYIHGTENGNIVRDTLYTIDIFVGDNTLIVQSTGNLNLLSTTLSADTVSRGDEGHSINLVFVNTGQGVAQILHPDSVKIRYNDSGLNYNIFDPAQNYPYTIPGGTTDSLQWAIQVRNDAQLGPDTIFVDAVAYQDVNSGSDSLDLYADQSDNWQIVGSGGIRVLSVYSSYDRVSAGQSQVPVTVRVTNDGQNPVNVDTVRLNISPDQYIASTLLNTAGKILQPAQTDTFGFNVSVNPSAASGAATLNASARGVDQYVGAVVWDSKADTTDSWLVQQKAEVSIVSMTPQTISAGQQFGPVLQVSNSGEARVVIDTSNSSMLFTEIAGPANFERRFAVQPANLNGGSQIPLYLDTTTVSNLLSGNFRAELILRGTENYAVFDSTIENANPLVIQTPADMLIDSVVAGGENISRGVDTTVFVYIRNTGQAAMDLDSIVISPYGEPVSITPELPFNMSGLSQQSFETIVNVPDNAPTGFIPLDARAVARDVNSGQVLESSAIQPGSWNVYTDAVISTTPITSDKQYVDQLDTLNLNMTIRNDGGSPVTVDTLILHPQIGLYEYLPPAFGFILSANSTLTIPYTLVVKYNSAVGPEHITAEVRYTNQYNNKSSISTDSDQLDITIGSSNPKISIVIVNAVATQISQGQQNTPVEIRLENTGSGNIRIDSLRLNFNNDSNYSYEQADIYVKDSMPVIYLPVTLPPGSKDTLFVIPVDVNSSYFGPDTMNVRVYFTNLDDSDNIIEEEPSVNDCWIVQQRPIVHIDSVGVTPVLVSTGQTGLQGRVYISNEGGLYRATAIIDTVQLQMFMVGVDSSSQFVITQETTPSLPLTLPAGTNNRFDFNLNVNNDAVTGTYNGSAWVESFDENDNQRDVVTTADAFNSVLVESAAQLYVNRIWSVPDTVSKGQDHPQIFTVIENTGQADAIINTVEIDFIASLVNLDFVPRLQNKTLPFTLNGGQHDTLIYSYEVPVEADTGGVNIYFSALGTDVNSGLSVSDDSTGIRVFVVQSPANVRYTSNSLNPYLISNDSTFSFILDVVNSGQASVALDPDSTHIFLSGSPLKIYLDAGYNTVLQGDSDTTRLTFRETLVSLPNGEYPVILNLHGITNDSVYNNSISTDRFFIGDTITVIRSIDIVGNSTVMQGDDDLVVTMSVLNRGRVLPIDNDIALTTLFFEHMSTGQNTKPLIQGSLHRTDNLDTLRLNTDPNDVSILQFAFDLPDNYPIGNTKITGRVSLDGGNVVLSTRGDSVVILVNSPGNAYYVANSLTPDSVVNQQVVNFSMAFADSGTSDITLDPDSTYITLNGERSYLAGRYILKALDTTFVQFEPVTINLPATGLYNMNWNVVGSMSNGTVRSFSGIISNAVRLIDPALPVFSLITIDPDTVRSGQKDIPMHFTVRNTGQSPAIVKNIQFNFSQGGQDVTGQWLIQNTQTFGDTIAVGAEFTYHPFFTLSALAVPGLVSPTPALNYSDVRTSSITRNSTTIIASDSVQIIKPATIRIDSLIAVTQNNQFVNRNQSFGLRLKITNSGEDRINRAYISLQRNGQPDTLLFLQNLGSSTETIIPKVIAVAGEYTYQAWIDSVFDVNDADLVIEQSVDNQETISVQTQADLTVAASITAPAGAADGVLSQNQIYTVSAFVENSGQAAYDSVHLVLRLPAGQFQIAGDPADSIRTFVATTGTVSWDILPLVITDSDSFTIAVKNIPFDMNTRQPAVISNGSSEIKVKVLEAGNVSNLVLNINAPTGAIDGIISTGQTFTVRSTFIYNEAVADSNRIARIRVNNPDYAISGETTRLLTPSITQISWNLVAPINTSPGTDNVTVWFYGIDKNTGQPIDSAQTNTVSLTLVEKSKLRLSMRVVEPTGAMDDTVSLGQAFKVETLVRHEGSPLVEDGSGRLSIVLPASFTLIDTLGISADVNKPFTVATSTYWWVKAVSDPSSMGKLQVIFDNKYEIESVQTEQPIVIAKPKKTTENMTDVSGGIVDLQQIDNDLAVTAGSAWIQTMTDSLPHDINTNVPASIANPVDSISIYVDDPAEIEIASVVFPDTVSTSQIFILSVNAQLIKNVINPQIDVTFLNVPYQPISMSPSGTVNIQFQVPATHGNPVGALRIILRGTDLNSGYPIASAALDTTMIIEKRATLAFSKPQVSFSKDGKPDSRPWEGELSEGQEFTIVVSPKYENYQGDLNYAGIDSIGRVKIDIKDFMLVDTQEPLEKEFTGLNESLSWALRAPRLNNLEVKSSKISFTFSKLPVDKNSRDNVALSTDSSAVSEAAVIRKKKIRVEMLTSGADTLLTVRVFNEEFDQSLNMTGLQMSFLSGPDGDEFFSQRTFRNTFGTLTVERLEDPGGAITKVMATQILTISADTAKIPLLIVFPEDLIIDPGNNMVIRVNGTYRNESLSREFRSKLQNIWVWDQNDSIYLDIVDMDLVPIDQSDLMVSNSIAHYSGTAQDDFFAYPNPFGRGQNQEAFISFRLDPGPVSDVDIKIFTLLGELVKTYQLTGIPGDHLYSRMIRWDGRNDRGKQVLNGVYLCFIDIKATGQRFVTKIAYIK